MANLTDADKVLRNDTGKSIVSVLETIANNTSWSGHTAGDLPLGNTTTSGSTAGAIGSLSTLTTTNKSSLVGAVNEVNATATIPFTGARGLSTNNCQIYKRGVLLVICIEIVLNSDQSGWYDILTTNDDVKLPSGLSLFGVVSTDSESIMPKYCQAYQSGTKMKVRIRNGKASGQYRGQIIVPLG